MEFKAYRKKEDYNYDDVFEFVPLGNSEPEYFTGITIDWLNMDTEMRGNVIRESCTCIDFTRRRRECKHIKECKRILSNDFKFRKDEGMQRWWCETCHCSIDTTEKEPKCYECQNPMSISGYEKRDEKGKIVNE